MPENVENTLRQIRNAVRFHREVSAKPSHQGDYYRLDRSDAAGYFAIHPKWEKIIWSYFKDLHNKGEEVVHVDICGRATAENLGASRSYCFPFKKNQFREIFAGPRDVFIEGDIFRTRDFKKLINRLKLDNATPNLVTFEPVAGLGIYYPYDEMDEKLPKYCAVTYGQLEKRFRTIFGLLKPGGYIYLDRPFQLDGVEDFLRGRSAEQYELSLQLKRITDDFNCKFEVVKETTGLYFLIRKHLKAKKRKTQ